MDVMDANGGMRRSGLGASRISRGLVAGLAVLFLASPAVAAGHRSHPARRGWTDGVVRCVAASAPPRRHAPVVTARRGALPTDRAVFFARSGDRCLWRHGVFGRG